MPRILMIEDDTDINNSTAQYLRRQGCECGQAFSGTEGRLLWQAGEIDLLLEQDGKLFPIEIKKMAAPPKKLTKVFDLIGKSPLERGTGAVLCMAERLGAFDKDNLIVPISLI